MKRLIISAFALSFFFTVHAQPWLANPSIKKTASEKGEFYQIQELFEKYWKDKDLSTARGWKQFKRWEAFMEPRVFPEGNINLPGNEIYRNAKEYDAANWKSLSPEYVPLVTHSEAPKLSGMGRVNTVAFHPVDPECFYLGTPSGGVWKTEDGGNSWVSVCDSLRSMGVSDIAVHPTHPDTLYLATGDGDAADTYGAGILKSDNGGLTWDTTSVNHTIDMGIHFRRILIHPSNPNILLAGGKNGLYRTEDGFKTHTIVKDGDFKDLEFKPGDPNVVYAAKSAYGGTKCKLFKSVDAGKSWSNISRDMDMATVSFRGDIALSPANPSVVYYLCDDKESGGFHALYRSEDGGNNWEKVYSGEQKNLFSADIHGEDDWGQGWYDIALALDPSDEDIVFVGGINMWKSVDGGESFAITADRTGNDTVAYVHADHHMLTYSPHTNELFSCNDGGLYISGDAGETWKDMSAGLTILQSYAIGGTPSNKDMILSGNQDNGTFLMRDGTWEEVMFADGMECLFHVEDDDTFIGSLYYGSFWKTTNGGEVFYAVGPEGVRGSGAWVTPLEQSKSDPNTLYAGYNNLYKSEDFGETWKKLTDFNPGYLIYAIAEAPSDPSYIYLVARGMYGQRVAYTHDGGATWEKGPRFDYAAVTSFAVSPNNPEEVWVTLSGYEDEIKVYRSFNGGSYWYNITGGHSAGLPNLPVNKIVLHQGHGTAYLGTDNGVYYRHHDMEKWVPFCNGLPNTLVTDLQIQEKWNRIIIGTFGRGIWESSLHPDDPERIYGEIHTPSRFACVGDPVSFTIDLLNAADSIEWDFDSVFRLVSDPEDTVSFTFNEPGAKDISALVYAAGDTATFYLNNYLEVKDEVDLQIIGIDTADYYRNASAVLLASGANEYTWWSDNEVYIDNPSASAIGIKAYENSTFYVEGNIGQCSDKDSIFIEVKLASVNDLVCNAIPLSIGDNGPFDNTMATIEENEPMPDTTNCNTQYSWCDQEGGLHNTLWYTFTGTGSTASFVTRGLDTQIALYEAENCEALLSGDYTLLAANDDFYGENRDYAAAIWDINLEKGKIYWLQMDGSAGGEQGEFYIKVDAETSANDRLSGNSSIHYLNVYPNPASERILLEYYSEGTSRVSLYSFNGRKMMDEKIASIGIIEKTIDIKETGIYVLQVITPDRIFNKRIVIE